MAIVIDTSALIEIERALVGGASVPPELADERAVLPAIVWAEALIGVRLADSPLRAAKRRAHLEAIRLNSEIVSFSAEVAEHYADIYAELAQSGTPIPQNDCAVAATARFLGSPLLVGSSDEAHFSRVAGLDVRVFGSSPARRPA